MAVSKATSAAQPSSLIIFTTAYDQYAIRAFTVNSIDYILKPVDEKRLLDAIVKYETLKGKDYCCLRGLR